MTSLTKEFHLGSTGDPASQSTQIRWKENMDLTKKVEKRLQTKGRKRNMEQRTFFTWFCDHADPSSDDIAEVIKDDMWPNPLQYYLVPDIEVENGIDGEEDGSEEEDGDDAVVVVEEEDEEDEIDGDDVEEEEIEEVEGEEGGEEDDE